jgi:hypothetical protein
MSSLQFCPFFYPAEAFTVANYSHIPVTKKKRKNGGKKKIVSSEVTYKNSVSKTKI